MNWSPWLDLRLLPKLFSFSFPPLPPPSDLNFLLWKRDGYRGWIWSFSENSRSDFSRSRSPARMISFLTYIGVVLVRCTSVERIDVVGVPSATGASCSHLRVVFGVLDFQSSHEAFARICARCEARGKRPAPKWGNFTLIEKSGYFRVAERTFRESYSDAQIDREKEH